MHLMENIRFKWKLILLKIFVYLVVIYLEEKGEL